MLLFVFGIVIAIVVVAATVAIPLFLKKQSKSLANRISAIRPFGQINAPNPSEPKEDNVALFIDIESDLKNSFENHFITFREKSEFSDHYAAYFQEARHLAKKLNTFHICVPDVIAKFIHDFNAIDSQVERHNESVNQNLLECHKAFFDHCLQYPLDEQQRRSIVTEEDNCLVVSSAGSGKTSSIVGKVKYLLDIKHVAPQKILLISYTNKAAAELTERMNTPNLRGYTFHKLALDMIGQATGQKPSICDNTDALFVKIYHELSHNEKYKKDVLKYYVDFQETEEEQRKREIRQRLSEQKNAKIKAQVPDMDGQAIYVRSMQERKICFALSALGIKFRYEAPYEHSLADETHSQYKPDFSIYYERQGETKRVYLEHFGIDEHGQVPVWFAKDRGISYEEANRQYNDGITWKKEAHKKFGTTLITISSADFYYFDIHQKLKTLLKEIGVPIHEKTEAELYDIVNPSGSKQEKALIRLIATFVTLAKSSCKTISDILLHARSANDERNYFIIKNVFYPVFERYADELRNKGQIDFTDAILQATEICKNNKHLANYEYIIVDEFQDISIDRYNFLHVLRAGNPPAKLYCVGDDWQSIYRFSGSDMALFNQFADYFGPTEINKIETTYRFGEPLVGISSQFIQRNGTQIKKDIHPFRLQAKTELQFCPYNKNNYCSVISQLIATIPSEKSIFLLGRYSFDDYFLSLTYKSVKEGNRFFYLVGDRKIEFLTIHKSKGLEADYVIILQCNKDTYGFPTLVTDDSSLNYVLTASDQYPYGEERRLFYVAITRAKIKTWVLYDERFPSVFVDEFLHPEKLTKESYAPYPNANKKWTRREENRLLALHRNNYNIKQISKIMGRSPTSIVMRLEKLQN